MSKLASQKLSDTFRKELRALGRDQTVRFIVTLDYPATTPIVRHGNRTRRKEAIETSDKQMEKALSQWIRPVLRDHGGELVHVSPQLRTITVQGRRPLIEQLTKVDAVTAIIENQTIHGLHR